MTNPVKTFSSYNQMSKEYFANWTKRYAKLSPQYESHPREDYHLVSDKYPIFAVADGVTLKRDAEGNYPVPSGVFELAKKFCESVVSEAEKRYDLFGESGPGSGSDPRLEPKLFSEKYFKSEIKRQKNLTMQTAARSRLLITESSTCSEP